MFYQIATVTLALYFFVTLSGGIDAAALPSDFEDALVTSVGSPTSIAFTPDNRLLITTQLGQVRVYQNGALVASPALDINARLCTNSERGLLGVAVDSNFNSNKYVYFYYTFNKNNNCPLGQPTSPSNPVNRVSRFVLADNNTISAATETVLVDNIVSPNGNHNGGDLHFGKDNLLYISMGDGKVADIGGVSQDNGANLIQWDYWGGDNQRFKPELIGNGFYKITAKHSGKALEIYGFALDNGKPVVQWDFRNGENQQWQLVPVDIVR